ncbi:MAG: FAD-dependent oxidoreductase, partial [Clostridia bacterium]|nr:FAD-dependent oxidoreductase [Clostridia bacterium]
MSKTVNIIGAGLAGCEAAWQLSRRGIKVDLYDIKPQKLTPAHSSENYCELVCSNSLKSNDTANAHGLLKQEMREFDSLIIDCAYKCAVPAGSALAVGRNAFSSLVTDVLKAEENISIICREVTEIDTNNITIIATGPLT